MRNQNKMDILVNEELLRTKLTPCREICPVLLDVFTWRKDVYPLVISGIVTFIFLTLWYLDPPVITAFAVFGLIITILDYCVPLVSKAVNQPTNEGHWTSEKEKKFSIFINRIAYYSVQVWNFYVTVEEFKKERPNSYSACVIVFLLFLAWIGNTMNNLFLAYLLVVFLTLLPGLLHRRLIQAYVSTAFVGLASMLGLKKKSN